MKRKKEKEHQNRYVEVKTNKKGWVKVEFLQLWPNGKILIRLPDGQVIIRKNKHVRSVTSIVVGRKTSLKSSYWKQFKTKKKRRKVLKKGKKKVFKKLSDKWKDPKVPKMPRKEI